MRLAFSVRVCLSIANPNIRGVAAPPRIHHEPDGAEAAAAGRAVAQYIVHHPLFAIRYISLRGCASALQVSSL